MKKINKLILTLIIFLSSNIYAKDLYVTCNRFGMMNPFIYIKLVEADTKLGFFKGFASEKVVLKTVDHMNGEEFVFKPNVEKVEDLGDFYMIKLENLFTLRFRVFNNNGGLFLGHYKVSLKDINILPPYSIEMFDNSKDEVFSDGTFSTMDLLETDRICIRTGKKPSLL